MISYPYITLLNKVGNIRATICRALVAGQQVILENPKRQSASNNTMFPNRRPMPPPSRIDFFGPPGPSGSSCPPGPPPPPRFGGRSGRGDFNRPPMPPIFNRHPDGPPMPMDFPPPRMDLMDWNDSEYSNEDYKLYTKVQCGELRERHTGMLVEIGGKVHKQRLGRFLTLKDSSGMTQCIVPDDKPYLVRKISNIPIDSYLVIYGKVNKRPKNQRNTIMTTGNIEVAIDRILSVNRIKKKTKSISMMQVRQASSCAKLLGVTSEEFKRCASPSLSKKFSNRTHNCGELNPNHKGQSVTLCGWIESKQGRFIQLRDGYGLVQTVVPAGNDEVYAALASIIPETLITLTGNVCLRPESQINNTIPTGEIEVQIQSIKIMTKDSENGNNNHGDDGTTDSNNDLAHDESNNIVDVNSFTVRTHNCGQLRPEHIGQVVTLCGWLEFHRVGKFVILRDGYGRTQLIIPEENKQLQQEIDKLPYESILKVTGVVTSRPPSSEQPAMSTGSIEVVIQECEIVNRSHKQLPFNLREFNKAKEATRMQHRYLDLRYPEMQRNLRTRSRILMDMRDFLINHAGFVDVETPTLFRATPGGAQEFVVPTRTPGQFYSLVQSPQQFKQMLMSGAIDRYFQIARCYRDEGSRSDRQPEFTQLDIEMSFTTCDGVIDLVERLLRHCWPKYMESLTLPFPRMTYAEAIDVYGSDKPDLTFGNKLISCKDIFLDNKDTAPQTIKLDDSDFDAKALIFRKPYTDLTASLKTKYDTTYSSFHSKVKLVQFKFHTESSKWISAMDRLLGNQIPEKLINHLNLNDDCVLFLAYGNKHEVCTLLGKIRTNFVQHLEKRSHEIRSTGSSNFLWVVDFPLFEKDADNRLQSVHHPFTSPHPDDLELIDTEPLKARSLAYDLVFNGHEIAGGSIRIHDPDLQKKVLDKLKIPHDSMQHLLDALGFGCPPHGGIALGLDRLISLILKTNSIRDVIAFPKTIEGRDPVSGAPVPISDELRKLYHLESNTENSILNVKQEEEEDISIYFDSNTSIENLK